MSSAKAARFDVMADFIFFKKLKTQFKMHSPPVYILLHVDLILMSTWYKSINELSAEHKTTDLYFTSEVNV